MWIEGGESFNSAREITLNDTWRQALVVSQKDEVWRVLSDGLKKISTITCSYMHQREFALDIRHAYSTTFDRSSALDSFNVLILRHDHRYISTLHRFTKNKPMPLVEKVERAENHDKLRAM